MILDTLDSETHAQNEWNVLYYALSRDLQHAAVIVCHVLYSLFALVVALVDSAVKIIGETM